MIKLRQFVVGALMALLPVSSIFAADKSRGLWACKTVNGKDVFVSWRMRATDAPRGTTYNLYADGELVSSSKTNTNVTLSSAYEGATFSLEVLNSAGEVIDSQSNVKLDGSFVHSIKLNKPADYTMTAGSTKGTTVTYSPNDASAYDMDGDGEQEIILSWEGSNIGATCTPTAPPILDCYKLDGTLLWRINFGPNVLGGCRFSFLCYDFDGDGYGEVIGKTAQGSKDATGNYLSKGVAAGANHSASSVNSSGVITDGGKEWITCFDGRTGKELATIDYWPYFNIQSNWNPGGNTDGNGYGHRGNWFKATAAVLPVNGKKMNCAVTVRGIYTFSYAAAYSWDGKTLSNVWKHTSDVAGQGIYGQGAHSVSCGDMDGDGYDEILVGAAALDHDGKLLWRSGLGHGDATHLGDFDPNNDGLEVFIVLEEGDAKYDCALLDAKTGKVLLGRAQTGGDTGRGLILDCDPNYDGSEIFEISDSYLFDCKGNNIAEWKSGTIVNSSINYRIYWDGDLLDEYHDRSHVDKWNPTSKSWDRTLTLYSYGYANTNNASKNNPCVQADLYGDWREEAVFWGADGAGDVYMTIFTTTTPSDYKLPWLRDDHTYDLAITWQNCGYNQPPHLGYSPVEYYKALENAGPAQIGRWGSGGARNQTVEVGTAMTTTVYNFSNANTVKVVGILPPGVTATVENGQIKIGGTPTRSGVYQYSLITDGAYDGNEVTDVGGTITVPFGGVPTITKHGAGSSSQTLQQNEAIVDFFFTWAEATTVTVDGLPKGLKYDIDNETANVYFSGTVTDNPGKYVYTITTVGNDSVVTRSGTITIQFANAASLKVGQQEQNVEVYQDSVIPSIVFYWENAFGLTVEGLPTGVTYEVDEQDGSVTLSGSAYDYPGTYTYTVATTGGNPDAVLEGEIVILENEKAIANLVGGEGTVSVSPNPMSSAANVSVTTSQNECNWSLFSAAGVLCQQGQSTVNAGKCNFSIQRGGLASGVYILRIEADDVPTFVKLVVK